MDAEKLKTILDKHLKWLKNESGGERANLRSADLTSADLTSADLTYANLRYANLMYANLTYADLTYANLMYANLRSADLTSADLTSANLTSANLTSANLDKRYIVISCIGSRKDSTTYCFDDDKIWCGCFSGTLDEFESKVNETHKSNPQYLKEYLGAITYIRGLK